MAEQAEAIQAETLEIPDQTTALKPAGKYDPVLQQIATSVGTLSNMQIQVLGMLCENITSSIIKSDREIAKELGIDHTTVWRYRKNPQFAMALAMLMRSLAQGTTEKALSNLMKLSEKDTKATEIWLRIAKVFDPVQKSINLNAQFQVNDQVGTFQDWIDECAVKMGAAGYPIEEFVKRYHELRSEGAF